MVQGLPSGIHARVFAPTEGENMSIEMAVVIGGLLVAWMWLTWEDLP